MKALDIIRRAFAGAFRSRLRTCLTVLAIVIGAFTLTLTNAVGAGINTFMSDTVATVGVDNVMTVFRANENAGPLSGPQVYVPTHNDASLSGMEMGVGASMPILPLTAEDLEEIVAIEGVVEVQPIQTAQLDYIQFGDSERYVMDMPNAIPGMHIELLSGNQLDNGSNVPGLILPENMVAPLGFADAETAVGQTVTLALTDRTGTQVQTEAVINGVAAAGLMGDRGAVPNDALANQLLELQSVGTPEGQPEVFAAAMVWFDPAASSNATTALQARLTDAGFSAMTLDDMLGAVTSVIDTVVLVLNGFAIIALVAASIGIINTLFMAVQERTREVGLMKAMGLSSSKVFALFSTEAMVLGLLGSAVGVILAIIVGNVTSATLASTVLSALPGLNLFVFAPATVAAVILGVMAVAFAAGTLPALRAAKADPISSLRYE